MSGHDHDRAAGITMAFRRHHGCGGGVRRSGGRPVGGSGLWDRRPAGWALLGRGEVQVGGLLPRRSASGAGVAGGAVVEQGGFAGWCQRRGDGVVGGVG